MKLLTRSELLARDPSEFVVRPHALPSVFSQHVLFMDKPQAWSSFDVIRKLRPLLQFKKIGHAGTLDPMATGLLICLTGRATKLMERFMNLAKTYEGTLRLGQTTASYDADTPVESDVPWSHLDNEDLEAARHKFIGSITQETPIYSAVKIGGERLYKKARRNEAITPPKRHVEVYQFDLLARDGADVSFRVQCSKGTYIRSIAHEFGAALGVGAHLTSLRRTHIGAFSVADAWTMQTLTEAIRQRDEDTTDEQNGEAKDA